MNEKICLVSLITDDIFFRLKPICSFLSRKYSQIIIVLFDWYNGKFDYSHIVNEFQKENYKVFCFATIKEGLNLINKFAEYDFLYLIKYPQVNLKTLGLWYLFVKNKAKKRWFSRCNVILIRKMLSKKNKNISLKESFLTMRLALKSSLLYLFFYIECLIVYYLILNPLVHLILKKKKKKSSRNFKNILFIRMDHLGDIICTLPSLKALKERFPDSQITFLGASWSCQPLKANPHLYDELILWDAPWHNKKNKYKIGIKEAISIISFILKLRKRHFDLVIQPRGEGMNVVLASLLNSSNTISGIDPNRPLARFMAKWIDKKIILNPYKTYHISEWPELCLKEIDIKITPKHYKNAYAFYNYPDFLDIINHYRQKNFKICCIVIGAGSTARLWSPQKFSSLINELYNKKIVSVLLGSKSDIGFRNKINVSVPLIDLVGKTDFRNIECVIRNSDFVISLDTSIMHLASLLGKKIIALFGAGNVNLARPRFSEHYIVKKELGCSGCGDICIFKKQKRYPCMEMITVNDILINLTKVL